MAHYLTIDQGNSVAKLALWEDDRLIKFSNEPVLNASVLEQFAETREISAALYCSVAVDGEGVVDELLSITRRASRLNASTPVPVKIDYGTPSSLGADRIAAATGAYTVCAGFPVLVVDIGTAVTYDVVLADGTFVGGNIAPGMKMRLDALHRYTARLPRLDVPETVNHDEPMLGHDTVSAMLRGALFGIAGAVEYYRSRLPHETRVILTGGDARLVAPLCRIDVTVDEHLVSKGLNRILLYNEQL